MKTLRLKKWDQNPILKMNRTNGTTMNGMMTKMSMMMMTKINRRLA